MVSEQAQQPRGGGGRRAPMLALALPDQVVGVGAVPVQPADDAEAIADADAPVAVGRVGGAASATSDPDAAVAVGRRLEAAVVVVMVLLLLLPLVVSGAVAPSLGRRAEAGEPSPASAPRSRGARGARAVPVVVLPRPCPGGPGGRAPEVAPGAGAEERGERGDATAVGERRLVKVFFVVVVREREERVDRLSFLALYPLQ